MFLSSELCENYKEINKNILENWMLKSFFPVIFYQSWFLQNVFAKSKESTCISILICIYLYHNSFSQKTLIFLHRASQWKKKILNIKNKQNKINNNNKIYKSAGRLICSVMEKKQRQTQQRSPSLSTVSTTEAPAANSTVNFHVFVRKYQLRL